MRHLLGRPDPDLAARTDQFLGQQLLIGQHGPIFGGQNPVWEPLKCVVRLGDTLCRADNETNRRVLSGLRPVLTGIILTLCICLTLQSPGSELLAYQL
jgi:hypothetical protein